MIAGSMFRRYVVAGLLVSTILSCALNDPPYRELPDGSREYSHRSKEEAVAELYYQHIRSQIFEAVDRGLSEACDNSEDMGESKRRMVSVRFFLDAEGEIMSLEIVEDETTAGTKVRERVAGIAKGAGPFGKVPRNLLNEDQTVGFQLKIFVTYLCGEL